MRKVFLLAFLTVATQALAQEDLFRFGSAYSSFGIGELQDFKSSYAEAMGVTGIGMYNPVAPGLANPAFLGLQNLTTASSNLDLRHIVGTSGGVTGAANQLRTSSLMLQFPLIKNKLGMSVSLIPLAQRSYQLKQTELRASNDPSLRYNMLETGEGNLNRLELGFGARITGNLYAGYAGGLVFGGYQRENVADFFDLGKASAKQVHITSHRGMSNRFGLSGKFGRTARGGYRVIGGATLDLPVNLRVSRQLDDYFVATPNTQTGGIPRQTTNFRSVNASLPLAAGAGISVNYSQFVMLGAEVLHESWSGFSHPDDITGLVYRNRLRLGAGGQWSPDTRNSRAFWRKYQYRSGFFIDSGNAEITGTRIATTGITTGLSFPSPLSGSTIDVNAMLGWRGAASPGLVQETVFQMRVTLNLSEFMFFKRYIQ